MISPKTASWSELMLSASSNAGRLLSERSHLSSFNAGGVASPRSHLSSLKVDMVAYVAEVVTGV